MRLFLGAPASFRIVFLVQRLEQSGRGPVSKPIYTERVHHRVYATRAEGRRDLFGYIEGVYNPRRQHSALAYISLAEAERRAA